MQSAARTFNYSHLVSVHYSAKYR